jgi:UDP:flavonoid glycosyltransferase YjiC (YdhE family)
VGSLGDLHPFIALGRALLDRGLTVVLACAEEYRDKVQASGVSFQPMRPSFEQMQNDLGVDRAELTRRAVEHSVFLFRKLILPYVRMAYEDMMPVTADADLVITSSLAFGARYAAEKRGITVIAVVLQPMMFLSAYDPPVIPKAEWLSRVLRRLGPVSTGFALSGLKTAANMLFRPLRALRDELGLPATRANPLFDGQFGEGGAIGMYSPLLGAVQADFPKPTTLTGFATFDSHDGLQSGLEPELAEFLRHGADPLVFTLGSVVVNNPGGFFRESVRAARLAGMRAVLLVGELGTDESLQSAEVFVCPYARHSLLFPRAAAIVHHGGIGTLAQAMRSGRPQIVVPYFADQLDNAARAARLGVARLVPPRRYSGLRVSGELGVLLGQQSYLRRAQEIGQLLGAEDGAAGAARVVLDSLERLGRK